MKEEINLRPLQEEKEEINLRPLQEEKEEINLRPLEEVKEEINLRPLHFCSLQRCSEDYTEIIISTYGNSLERMEEIKYMINL